MGGAAVSTTTERRANALAEMRTPRTDALRAKLAPLAATLSVDNFGEVAVQCITESIAQVRALERELAEARDVIADLLAKAVPASAESGDEGRVFAEMTEAEWQRVVDATTRARAFLA
jgi:hypothetical protein